jgi:hypothetical protein
VKNTNQRKEKWVRTTRNCVLTIFFIWAILVIAPHLIYPLTKTAQIGDASGLVNSLFSALALGGVVIAILIQGEELKIQQQELELTRNVLIKQEQQLNEQAITMSHQRLEITIFNIIERLQAIIETTSSCHNRDEIIGANAYSQYLTDILYSVRFRQTKEEYEKKNPQRVIDEFVSQLNMNYTVSKNFSQLVISENLFFYLLELINIRVEDNDLKKNYIEIVTNQLAPEYLIYLYNMQEMLKIEFEETKPLWQYVISNNLLKSIPPNLFIRPFNKRYYLGLVKIHSQQE